MDPRVLVLIALSKVYADVAAVVKDASCKSQLTTVKSQLEKLNEASKNETLLATLLVENPAVPVGQPHWPTDRAAYVPPLVQYWNEMGQWIRTEACQWIVALIVLTFGLICVFNGPASFRTLLIWGTGLVAAGSAKYEVELLWPDLTMSLVWGVALEAGLIAALIIYVSYEGTKAVLGVGLGLWIGLQLDAMAHTEYWPLNASLAWYSAWGFIGILALTVFQRRVMAILAPLLGGFLCSSAIGYFIMAWAWCVEHSGSSSLPDWVDVRGDNWLAFACELLGGTSNAGVVRIQQSTFPVQNLNYDMWGGRLVWFLFFWYGMKRQWRIARQISFTASLKDPLLGSQKVAPYEISF